MAQQLDLQSQFNVGMQGFGLPPIVGSSMGFQEKQKKKKKKKKQVTLIEPDMDAEEVPPQR